MSHRGTAEGKTTKSDPIYHNRLVNMLVNPILKHGKKSLAYPIIYREMKKIQQKTKKNDYLFYCFTSSNTWSNSRYSSKSKMCRQIDSSSSLGFTQGKALTIHWLLVASRKRLGRNMAFKFSFELVDAAKGSDDAIRKKEETHRMAEANRTFAHFR